MNKHSDIRISVALATFNGEKFLNEQLESVLCQTSRVHEIVVCDDHSVDNTPNILNRYDTNQPDIFKIYVNDENLGVIKNFEKAISLCTGDIIFLADQDDVWERNKVEKCVRFFCENPGLYGVFTNARIIEESGQPIDKTLWDLLGFETIKTEVASNDLFRFMLFYGNIIAGNCLVITRDAIDLIFPFKYIEGMWHDEWIAMKLAEHNKIGFIDEALTMYRMHNDQQTKWLWSNREEKNKKRYTFITRNPSLYSLDYYKHWSRRIEIAKELSQNGFAIDNCFLQEILKQKKEGLLHYLKSKSFARKKWKLLLLKLKGQENITFLDFIRS